ncbi:hypothetical protein SADUNF_Sadunf11G0000800 [Salix dunnii]|uniref:Cytochrome P450 n=1 Tax=Salix dunnii TaxID=1413687 RepID=A0A835JS81_9ROSI|nr:hypothetical protein SADUNF_Sadunf11G0000800 [Salix dunnii]
MRIEQGSKRDVPVKLFQQLLESLVLVPINLPLTRFNRSLQASEKIREIVMDLIREKTVALVHQNTSPQQDLITSFLSLRNDNNSVALSDEEIVDNAIIIMIGAHDTSSILRTFLIRLLAKDLSVYAGVVQGFQLWGLPYSQRMVHMELCCPGISFSWDPMPTFKDRIEIAIEPEILGEII